MARNATVGRSEPQRGKTYHAEWISRPGNKAKHLKYQQKWVAKPGNRDKINARRRELRSLKRQGVTEFIIRTCCVCSSEFECTGKRGRPRQYCNTCSIKYFRSERRCGQCGWTVGSRRITCQYCGAIWRPEKYV